MKSLNLFKFTKNVTVQLENIKQQIEQADTFPEAKKQAVYAMGFIDCFATMENTIICMENNEITAQLDTLENEWRAEIYQVMVEAAERFHDMEKMFEYAKLRDSYREYAEY